METEEVFTFRQSELPNVSFAVFEDMRNNGEFCDLTIKIQNQCFVAHRMVLAAVIPYFRSVFASNVVEAEEKEIAVEELDPGTLGSLISFAYTNTVDISSANAKFLLVASQFLQLNQVCDACVEYLTNRLRIDNVLPMREFADSVDNSKLIENCNLYIRRNFEEFSENDVFLSSPDSFVREIISSDDLNVSREEIVFEALMRWVRASPSERHVALPALLCEVRMKYLPVSYLVDRVGTEEFIESFKPCRELVDEVKRYHLLPYKNLAFPTLNKPPRNSLMQDLYAVSSCTTCGTFVHCFDSVNEKWCHLASNKAEHGRVCNASAVNGKIYTFLDKTIHIFYIKSRKWEVLKSMNIGITGAAIVPKGNKIYCFGSDQNDFKDKVRCFDTQQNGWMITDKMKTARDKSSAVTLGEYIYISGGRPSYDIVENTVEKYDPLTGEMTGIAPMRASRYGHGSASLNGKIYVCGGGCTWGTLKTAEVYIPLTDQWNFISSLNNGINASCRLVSYCNKIYAFRQSHEEAEIYDPKYDEWKYNISVPGGVNFALSIPSSGIQYDSD